MFEFGDIVQYKKGIQNNNPRLRDKIGVFQYAIHDGICMVYWNEPLNAHIKSDEHLWACTISWLELVTKHVKY